MRACAHDFKPKGKGVKCPSKKTARKFMSTEKHTESVSNEEKINPITESHERLKGALTRLQEALGGDGGKGDLKEAEEGEFQGQMDPSKPSKRGGLPPRGSGYRGQAKKTEPRSKEEIARLNTPVKPKMEQSDPEPEEDTPLAGSAKRGKLKKAKWTPKSKPKQEPSAKEKFTNPFVNPDAIH